MQQDLKPNPSACSSLVTFWTCVGQGGIFRAARFGGNDRE